MAVDAYPLSWPDNKPRTGFRMRSKFEQSLGRARDALLEELKLLHATHVIVSSNIPVCRDGLPYADAREPADPGVAVYFHYKGRQLCFACDKWMVVRDNLYAVAMTIGAIRGIARWGTGDMIAQAALLATFLMRARLA